ncbi:DoxX family protein [Tamlana sp. 2_MG-2023]|uniref:DoxX family protein n=1 Tax=unclassified Tamlana TaxID=2614803 RepID=UPI0026E49215|nr:MULTISPECIES: DoxX family protein [unclassified Tamlana]MDO6761725.1 DoxX family protein [Tamlana sp. 2_MG-2023]MDO6792279.1 DoxX family protein [Tamlana sp. 1_MG-2023]
MKTNKRNKIIYWIATIWLSLGMLSTGIVQLLQLEENIQSMELLGYPMYLLSILGIWKILGVITILIPKFPLLKEWAYAGFFFVMSGAIISHVAVGDELITLFGPTLLLVLTIVSWYFRPANRKLEKQ